MEESVVVAMCCLFHSVHNIHVGQKPFACVPISTYGFNMGYVFINLNLAI